MFSSKLLRFAAGALVVLAVAPAHANPITLDQAFQRSAKRPLVGMATASTDAATSEASGARRAIYNPELSVAVGPRLGGGQTLFDFQATLSQTIEMGGKRAARVDAANARLNVARSELAIAGLDARIETWRSFQLALLERERMRVAKEAETLAVAVDAATVERQKLGFGTQLQANLTTAELGRARHDLLDAERRYEEAIVVLATVIGAGPQERIEPDGNVAIPNAAKEATATLEALLARALNERPDLRTARAELEAARADVRAADAQATPDLTLGVSYAYEQDPGLSTHAILGSASIAIPIRNRNQGARGAARAREKRAEIDVARITANVEREVRIAFASYQRTQSAVAGFDIEVNERLHENLQLASESFTSGKIDYFQFTVVRRELIANRQAYLDAVGEVIESWSSLMRATGGEVKP
jgi:cobalt-zinc-cadmium efflux system outer membrane protein